MTDTAPDQRWVPIELTDDVVGELSFDENGLIAAIAQDATSRDVLMMAWMNEESLRRTLAEGRMVYWSRSRQELWRKGDTSGDTQLVRAGYYDCDGDTVLFIVDQTGRGACHTGTPTCFFRSFAPEGAS